MDQSYQEGDPPSAGDVTALLHRLVEGDADALDRVYPFVYDELRRIADRHLRRESPGHTLEPTALVHEAYVKLSGAPPAASGRSHFLALASRAMRQVLVDHARSRRAAKRGGGAAAVSLPGNLADDPVPLDDLLALDDALRRLDDLEPRLREVVEYRYFGGLTDAEAAEVLGVSRRTVLRDWARARAWLYRELYAAPDEHTD